MNAAVAEPETTPEVVPPVADAERDRHDLFEYSRWLHVGEGALECPHNTTAESNGREAIVADGKCTDANHFHAWVRLPNQFQARDIAEKSRAAAARRRRMLRDPASDPFVILESELDEIRDEAVRPVLVEELLEESYFEIYRQATRNVEDIEETEAESNPDGDEVPKRWAHIEADREEYQRLSGLPEDQRDAEEFRALEARVADYSRAVEAEIEKLQQPRRETLEQKPMDDLIEMVRRRRIEAAATEVYLHTFNTWTWFVCTYKPRANGTPNERVWKDVAQMKYEADPTVIDALKDNFTDLETKLARDRGLGNS